jgi:hypothetical protein
MRPPQPSATLPQFMPAGHCSSGVQAGAPQTFAVPAPPQICPLGQELPQSSTPPQPSAI